MININSIDHTKKNYEIINIESNKKDEETLESYSDIYSSQIKKQHLEKEKIALDPLEFLNFDSLQHLFFDRRKISIEYAPYNFKVNSSILDPSCNSLLDLSLQKIKTIVKNNGIYQKSSHSETHHLFILELVNETSKEKTLEKDNKKHKPIAMAHFLIHDNVATIKVIMVDGFESKGYASMLLLMSLAVARKEKCRYVRLTSTEEGAYLYALFGFRPIRGIMPKEMWHRFDYAQKVRMIIESEVSEYLNLPPNEQGCILDFEDPEVQSLLQMRYERILNPQLKTSKSLQIQVDQIPIPKEAFSFGILLPDHISPYSITEEKKNL